MPRLGTHPAERLAVGFNLVLAGLILALAPVAWRFGVAHLGLAALVVALAHLALRVPAGQPRFWFRAACAAPAILTAFSLLGGSIHRLNPHDMDLTLEAADRWLFGVSPTLWLESFSTPAATELLQAIYATFYLLPFILAFLMARAGLLRAQNLLLTCLALGFYTNYLGYIVVPAVGPRVLLAERYAGPLEGLWLAGWLHATIDGMEHVKRNCFPSGHTGITLIVVAFAARYRPRSLWFYVPVAVGMLLATVYLRYHHVIDVIAGVPLALWAVGVGPLVAAGWEEEPVGVLATE